MRSKCNRSPAGLEFKLSLLPFREEPPRDGRTLNALTVLGEWTVAPPSDTKPGGSPRHGFPGVLQPCNGPSLEDIECGNDIRQEDSQRWARHRQESSSLVSSRDGGLEPRTTESACRDAEDGGRSPHSILSPPSAPDTSRQSGH